MKNKKGLIIAIVIVAVVLCLSCCCCSSVIMFGKTENEESSKPSTSSAFSTEIETSVITTSEIETTVETTTETEEIVSEEKKQVIVSGYGKSMSEDNTPIVTIYYEFTNLTSEEATFVGSFADSVTQSGHSLYSLAYVDEEAVSQIVPPNGSIVVGIVYEVVDDSPIYVEITDLFGKEVYLEETLE